jgi:hypothetical protein
MSVVFQNTKTLTPTPRRVRAWGGHTRWVERGVNIFGRRPTDTALYSTYVSTLWTHLLVSQDRRRLFVTPWVCLLCYIYLLGDKEHMI